MFETVNNHAAAVGTHINALKTRVMSALISYEQHQAVLLGGESLEEVGTSKCACSMFITNGQGTKDIRNRNNHVSSLILRLGCGTKYQFVQRAGSTRQWYIRLSSTDAICRQK